MVSFATCSQDSCGHKKCVRLHSKPACKSETQFSWRESSQPPVHDPQSQSWPALIAHDWPHASLAFTRNIGLPKGQPPHAASRQGAHIGPILHVALLPHAGLLAISGRQAVAQPEDDQPWQTQQTQRLLDEGLQTN